jgi:hypothetical protein
MRDPASPPTVEGLLRSGWEDTAAPAANRSYAQLWAAFSRAAQTIEESDPEAGSAVAFLARICSLRLPSDPSPNPFRVLISTAHGRTMAMVDFTGEEVTFLRDVVKHVSDYRMRARAADLLWVLGERHERAKYAAIAIENYKMWPLHHSQWSDDGRAAWSRAVDLSKRDCPGFC